MPPAPPPPPAAPPAPAPGAAAGATRDGVARTPAGAFPILAGLGRFWTAANALSVLRALLVPFIVARLWAGYDARDPILAALVGGGILSDFLDGKIARWSRTVSEWGKVLDPLADKLAAVAVVGALTFRPEGLTLPSWLFWGILVRDAVLVAGSFVLKRRAGGVAMSSPWGKLAVGALTLTVLFVLLGADPGLLAAAVGLTALLFGFSFLLYVARFARLVRRPGALAAGPTP